MLFATPLEHEARRRRKPRLTYKSPSGDDHRLFLHPKTRAESSRSSLQTSKSNASETEGAPLLRRRIKCRTVPPLPLYHPLGRLALSLPPLDPVSIGLPAPVRLDDASRRLSSRTRRVGKTQDASEVEETTHHTPAPASEVMEQRERASPRKRRGGGSSKRKRRDADDGDAAYPAKRTRLPRGTANHAQSIDEESATEAGRRRSEGNVGSEFVAEQPEERRPERRTTRTRGAAKRRNSSASETQSLMSDGTNRQGVDALAESTSEKRSGNGGASPRITQHKREEKEDGELSDASRPGL